MPCYHPIPAQRDPVTGTVSLRARDLNAQSDGYLLLPCGTCIGCRTSRAREWAIRGKLENMRHQTGAFVTLTYNGDAVPPTLHRAALRAWLKRVRAAVYPVRIRFLACGEYGEQRKRPHYHAIIWGAARARPLEDAWRTDGRRLSSRSLGFVQVSPITDARIAYTAGYVSKKIGFRHERHERVDPDTGECYVYQPPFLSVSSNPGLASWARVHASSWRSHALHNGHQVPAPRYLHKAWLQQATLKQIIQLEEERSQRPRPTEDYLRAAEAIALAHERLNNSTRYV